MVFALQITLIVTSLLVVLLVLLHRAKGGGLSTLFGGGVQSSLSGSTVVEVVPGAVPTVVVELSPVLVSSLLEQPASTPRASSGAAACQSRPELPVSPGTRTTGLGCAAEGWHAQSSAPGGVG